MGLDGVEILMDIEETFGIEIADNEAADIITVDDLYHVVKSKLTLKNNAKCKTSPVFYRIRKALIQLFGISRSDIKTDSKLSSLIPAEKIQQNWSHFQQVLSLQIPALERPASLRNAIFYPSLTLGIIGLGLFIIENILYALLLFLLSIGYAIVLTNLTKSKMIVIPKEADMMSKFVYKLLHMNPDQNKEGNKVWADKEIYKLVQSIIAAQVCLPIEKITREASLVDDLGID